MQIKKSRSVLFETSTVALHNVLNGRVRLTHCFRFLRLLGLSGRLFGLSRLAHLITIVVYTVTHFGRNIIRLNG